MPTRSAQPSNESYDIMVNPFYRPYALCQDRALDPTIDPQHEYMFLSLDSMDDCFARFRRLLDTRRLSAICVLFFGPRGSGKRALLKRCCALLKQQLNAAGKSVTIHELRTQRSVDPHFENVLRLWLQTDLRYLEQSDLANDIRDHTLSDYALLFIERLAMKNHDIIFILNECAPDVASILFRHLNFPSIHFLIKPRLYADIVRFQAAASECRMFAPVYTLGSISARDVSSYIHGVMAHAVAHYECRHFHITESFEQKVLEATRDPAASHISLSQVRRLLETIVQTCLDNSIDTLDERAWERYANSCAMEHIQND